jgi:membrane associated rhomboid family serine protease
MNRYASVAPPAVLNILIANCVAFLATKLLSADAIYELFALFPVESPWFKIWQPVTYMFLHGDFSHLFFNMFALWMFGRGLEQDLGTKRFLVYYFTCGIGAGLVQLLAMGHMGITIGASGAVFGLLLAFGMLHPNATIMLLIPPIPMKAKWFVIIYGLVELLFGVTGSYDSVAHYAHLGGMFWGWLLLLWWRYQDRKRYRY